jgi:hypothetical protein
VVKFVLIRSVRYVVLLAEKTISVVALTAVPDPGVPVAIANSRPERGD